jgi:pyruvate carboxylase subunit B
VVDPRRKALRTAAGAGAGVVKTQMPGRIVRLLLAEGDTVAKGEPMLVVEAMKMENEIKAPRDGVIKRFAVAAGDIVEAKAVLVELED